MRTELVTAAGTSYLMTLAEVKKHLRMSTAVTVEDTYLRSLSKLATERLQDLTGTKLMLQTWKYYRDDWPAGDYIDLPYSPLNSGTSVAFIASTGGTAVSMGSTRWNADTVSQPPRIYLEYGDSWPTTGLYEYNAIRIEAKYGYSSGSTSVPYALKHAAKLLISDWYENRETFVIGRTISKELPNSVKSLVAPYRSYDMRSY